MSAAIDLGSIQADLQLDSGNLERGLAAARTALQAIEREIQRLQADFDAGAISLQSYTDRVNALTATQADLTNGMFQAYSACTTLNNGLGVVNASATRLAGQRFGGTAQGLLQLSYAVDDVRFGFGAIVNNIAPIVSSFTGSAGLASGLQIAAVGMYLLYEHSGDLADILGVASREVRTHADELEDLGKKTHKTADEQERYNKLKKESAEIDKLLHTRPQTERDEAKAINDALADADIEKVKKSITETMQATGRAPKLSEAEFKQAGWDAVKKEFKDRLNPFQQEFWTESRGGSATGKRLQAGQKRIASEREAKQLDDKVNELLARVDTDKSARAELIALVKANPNADGFKELAQRLEKAEAEAKGKEEKRNADEAKGALPGLDKMLASELKDRLGRGQTETKALADISEALKGRLASAGMLQSDIPSAIRGLTKEAAGTVAKDTVKDAVDAKDPDKIATRNRKSLDEAKKLLPTAEIEAKAEIGKRTKAGENLEKMFEDMNAKGAARLVAMGQTPEDAKRNATAMNTEAARAFLTDKAREDLRKQDPDYARNERSKQVARAEEAAPGIKDYATLLTAQGRALDMQGIAHMDVRDGIKAALAAKGIRGDEQAAMSKALAETGNRELDGKLADRAMHGAPSRNVDIHDASEMNARLQKAVGGEQDFGKSMDESLKKSLVFLGKIADQKGWTLQAPDTI